MKLGMQHLVLKYYQIPLNYDPRLTFDLFTQRSISISYAFAWKNALKVDYSETIEVYDIKVGIHSKHYEYKEIYMYQISRSFFDL